jgi:hypothetical protein
MQDNCPYTIKKLKIIPVIPALRKLRQEDCEVQARLGCTSRPWLKRKKEKKLSPNQFLGCSYYFFTVFKSVGSKT